MDDLKLKSASPKKKKLTTYKGAHPTNHLKLLQEIWDSFKPVRIYVISLLSLFSFFLFLAGAFFHFNRKNFNITKICHVIRFFSLEYENVRFLLFFSDKFIKFCLRLQWFFFIRFCWRQIVCELIGKLSMYNFKWSIKSQAVAKLLSFSILGGWQPTRSNLSWKWL